MLTDTLQVITQVAMLVFVVGSMAAMGLGLTLARITQPLRDLRLVVVLLLANFVVVPAAAIAAARLLPMDDAAATAVVLIGCVAGAPFLPKLAQLSRSDLALAVGAMVLLMVTTIVYARSSSPSRWRAPRSTRGGSRSPSCCSCSSRWASACSFVHGRPSSRTSGWARPGMPRARA